MGQTEKILIIRFSSFGDVLQCLSIPAKLQQHFPGAEIHWLTRQDMAPLIENHPAIQTVWGFSRKEGLLGLLKLAFKLRQEGYTRVYDAHNNLRSVLTSSLICFFSQTLLARRSVKRWKRFLLFRFRINTFQMPFNGQRDMLEPLSQWGLSLQAPPAPQLFIPSQISASAKNLIQDFEGAIALAPSAAFPLKRWPLEHWKNLILAMPQYKFVLLGGPEDTFLTELERLAPKRVLNLAGKCSLLQSSAIVSHCQALIANDTGLMHVGEQLGVPTIALMGPAPFGFPSRPQTKVLEKNLPCRPCSKHGQGPCTNANFHECLAGIAPSEVQQNLLEILK